MKLKFRPYSRITFILLPLKHNSVADPGFCMGGWPKNNFKARSAEKIFLGPSMGSGGMPPRKF